VLSADPRVITARRTLAAYTAFTAGESGDDADSAAVPHGWAARLDKALALLVAAVGEDERQHSGPVPGHVVILSAIDRQRTENARRYIEDVRHGRIRRAGGQAVADFVAHAGDLLAIVDQVAPW